MNLFYEDYPTTISVDGVEIPIVTDFREYVKMMDMLKTEDLTLQEKTCFLAQYFLAPPENLKKALDALQDFITMEAWKNWETAGDPEEETEEPYQKEKDIYSFEIDYPFLFSGFLQDYGINIRTVPYMHWWEFQMLFWGLSENTEIKQRIKYRSMDVSKIKDREERKRIEKIQNAIRLPDAALTDFDIGSAFA